MKKLISLGILILLILPTVMAIDLEITEKDSKQVIIAGLDVPATFDLEITNNGKSDEFTFFNLIGFNMEPKSPISIDRDETKEVSLVFYPRDIELRNYYGLQYFIRASDDSEQAEKVTVKILDLEDAFEIGAEDIDPESNSLDIYIHNKEDFVFNDLKVKFTSKFFELEEEFDLGPNKRKDFIIKLNKEDFKKLIAGFYTLKAEISIEDISAEVEGVIEFIEKDIVEETTKEQGGIISVILIEKTNNGNTIYTKDTVIEKNIISRLFTSFNPEPDAIDRKGTTVHYTWNKDIGPGETLQIRVRTNWLYPLLLIIFIVAIIVLVKKSISTDVIIRKKVSYVRAKGGEFALKVTLFLNSRAYVERVNIVDRLPSLMKVYERFGGEKPSRISEEARIIEWDFEKLEQGEIRTLSYIIYSKKIGILGKFALPTAVVIYQKDGKIKESTSNRAYFITEQRRGDIEED
jgi:hypothetical protein